MDILFNLGLLLITGYMSGWLLDKIGLPQIIGYILTGIVFSPHTSSYIDPNFSDATQPLMDVCLAFIAFEVGGALKWSKIKKHEKEIVSITVLASLFPFLLIAGGVFVFGILFPSLVPISPSSLMAFSVLLGALASPTAPAATLAVMHQYKAKGRVSETIMGVAALDDILGILLFSITLAIVTSFSGGDNNLFSDALLNSLYEIGFSVIIGIGLSLIFILIAKFYKKTSEGKWVVITFSLIILCVGISKFLHLDPLLSCMTMGVLVVNRCEQQRLIFRILARYTEELIFLFFFLLSGLHLDISTIPLATTLISLFVLLRILGKYLGAYTGARIVNANPSIRKYTAGGLLPQAGIVIGLVLSIYQIEEYSEFSKTLLTTIMGATVVNELIGPIAAKYSLMKAGEIGGGSSNKK